MFGPRSERTQRLIDQLELQLVRRTRSGHADAHSKRSSSTAIDPQACLAEVLARIADHKITYLTELCRAIGAR
jgi:hypothetical protein